MWTRGPAMLQAPASGAAKPFTISFDEAGTPATYPTAIGSFYAASNQITFGANVNFATYAYTNGTIGLSNPPNARSGSKFAHFYNATGAFSIQLSAALQARKVGFYYTKGSGWQTSVGVYGSGGQLRTLAIAGTSVSSWTNLIFDLDSSPLYDPAYWGSSFITEIRFNVSTFGSMAVDDLTVY